MQLGVLTHAPGLKAGEESKRLNRHD